MPRADRGHPDTTVEDEVEIVVMRVGSTRDINALTNLELVFPSNMLSRRSLRRLLRSPSAEVIAALRSGFLAGNAIVLFRMGSAVARLYSIAVAPELHRRGIGGRLLAKAETIAQLRGCHTIRLEVGVDNHAAIRLYHNRGYREFGRRCGYYEDGADALRFEKQLTI
jgi:ribosomal protein S18 acetylase RimI-like enzyme